MSRAPTDLEPREQARFSSSQKNAIRLRQSFTGADDVIYARCDECGDVIASLNARGTWDKVKPHDFDHSLPRGLYGKTTTQNGRAICTAVCHREKTDTDVAAISKADRQAGRAGQYARRLARKARGERPQLQGKGFNRG